MHIADLHIHSRYSRATSRDCTPEYLDLWARRKGIGIIGSGDFTHPQWRRELAEKLEPAGNGLYVLKKEYRIGDDTASDAIQPQFVITGEISSIYKKYDRVRKVHSLILLPGLEEAELVSNKLQAIGNIHSDGRPILGLDCHDLLEILLELCPESVYVPAHIWTPHFSLFGAFSGFDSVEECFGDLSPHIHAMETGLSSDPPMIWRVSALDRYQLISNSDAHSPAKLGREANLLDIERSYEGLRKAIQTGEGLAGTIEFFPEEGKYHYDGHRKCGLCLAPSETKKYGGICPVCGRKLTIGVSNRIAQLSDRPEGYQRADAAAFESLVPLPELIGASVGHSAAGARVGKTYQSMLQKLGPEFSILRELPLEDIRSVAGSLIAEGIDRLRQGAVTWRPGFDGEYGSLCLFTSNERQQLEGQMDLFQLQPELMGQEEEAQKQVHKGPEEVLPKSEHMCQDTAERKAGQERKGPEEVLPKPEWAAVSGREEPVWNEKQRQAIESIGRVTAVTAGPGTGKTGTLAAHILHLLETRRVKPSCITAVTFTNQAAGELRERIRSQLGKGPAGRLQIGSFHAIAWKRLKDCGMEFSLAGETETQRLAEELCREFGLSISASRLLRQISNEKTGMCERDPGLGQEALGQEVLEAYQRGLQEWGALDFDDLLLEALHFARREAGEQGRPTDTGPFSYLLVDEFQDINPLQYQLIKAWNQNGRELYVIGDRDQAIYGFRGADAGCFQRLGEDFPEVCRITLEENYRSTPQILAAATQVINKNPGGSRRLKPNRPEGVPVRIAEADSQRAEAIFVAKEINRLAGGIGMLEAQELHPAREGQAWGFEDIAVLYRTHRQAELLEDCLRQEGIPYVVAGRDEFLKEPVVEGTICFFQSLLCPEDKLAAERARTLLWGQEPEEGAERTLAAMAEKYAPLVKRKKPWKLLEEWRKDLKPEQQKDMEKLEQTAVFYQKMPEFLEALKLGVESDLKRCGGKQYTAGAVTLMTLHGAKGLEFPAVIIYGARKGLIPFAGGKTAQEEEEERRLFYVGLTRAREALILTTSREPSEFLEELPGELAVREAVKIGKREDSGRQMSLFDLM
ncbi:MAG: UvrD-helicase domain-containing protein [Lachnospiraceae bacterium]|nr:UvrD-helicase domain-containing protein [Lachnospiraceae bacterium]